MPPRAHAVPRTHGVHASRVPRCCSMHRRLSTRPRSQVDRECPVTTRSCLVGGVSSGCRFHIYFLIPPRPRSPCDPAAAGGLLACFFRIAGPAAAATHATRTCCYALHAGASLLACGCAYLVPRYGPDARRVRRDPLTSATWPRCGPRYPRLSPCSAPTHARRQCWRTVPPRQALGLPVDRGHGCDQPPSPCCRWVTLRSAPMDRGH